MRHLTTGLKFTVRRKKIKLIANRASVHLQPLVSEQLHLPLHGAGVGLGNLLQPPLQVLHRADELVHVLLLFSQLGSHRLVLDRAERGECQRVATRGSDDAQTGNCGGGGSFRDYKTGADNVNLGQHEYLFLFFYSFIFCQKTFKSTVNILTLDCPKQ